MDRNPLCQLSLQRLSTSLSARRAWIEIVCPLLMFWLFRPSLSARRAWIEIHSWWLRCWQLAASLSARRAWIEILGSRLYDMSAASLSARRAWIEILYQLYDTYAKVVALRKESVDRNNFCRLHNNILVMVALRKESVDRNFLE